MGFDPKKFKKLPLALQYKTIEEKGKYIMQRRFLHYTIELFQLDEQYIEVWRSIATNQIYWIECQSLNYVSDNYLSSLKIEKLFN